MSHKRTGKRGKRSVKTPKGPATMRTYMKDYRGTLSDEELEELFRHAAYGETNSTSLWLEDKKSQVLLRLLNMIQGRRR